MGNNSSGFTNEDNIKSAIHKKQFKDLNSNMQNFIRFAYPAITSNDIVKCEKIAGQNKCDIQISVHNTPYRLSIKEGSGNSVHQEPVEPFITFLTNEYALTKELANDIRFFIWGDGTFNGSGQKSDRLDVRGLKNLHPTIVDNIRNFFEEHKEDLIERFLLTGVCGDAIDFVYYGNENDGLWATREEFLKVVLNSTQNNSAAIPVGKLSFQAWNRAITGTSENKRGVIQLKWASLEKDLKSITDERR